MSTYSERESRLLGTMLNVLVAGMSDPSRLSRGRSYARQGAVTDLVIEPGKLTATVQGSRSTPYDVAVFTRPTVEAEAFAALVPKSRDVSFDCTCPDWDVPCKHAIAVMVHFAEVVSADADTLTRWRGLEGDTPVRAVIGSRRERGGGSNSARADEQRALDLAALAAFLGASIDVEMPELTPLPPPREAWDEPWTAMLRSALSALAEYVR